MLARSPFEPRALSGSIAGSNVMLTWTDPGDTAEFEREYGFAPGQRTAVFRVGATTALTIPGVPPGT